MFAAQSQRRGWRHRKTVMAVTEGSAQRRDAKANQRSLGKGMEEIHISPESRTKTVLNCVVSTLIARAGCRHVRDSDRVVHQQALGPRLSARIQIPLTLRALQWIVQ